MSQGSSDSDAELLDEVQRQTFAYFWDFAHPVSGLARDRAHDDDDPGDDLIGIGGSGFAAMAIVVAAERGWVTRGQALDRLLNMTGFLLRAECYHGIFPHFMNGTSGRAIPFSPLDDGGDLVETAFLMQGLLTARQYFSGDNTGEAHLRDQVDRIWRGAQWSWHTRGGEHVLYWHWSPSHGWAISRAIQGWNECLIAYVLAAGAPTYAIAPEVYHEGWTGGPDFRNGRRYYDIELPLGPAYGGPLFFAHYSFLGIDPRGLRDRHADYWAQNLAHVRINEAHCRQNPSRFIGYGPNCWGLTASDNEIGYDAHDPVNDRGAIAPTAALSSFPYWPQAAMRALRHFRFALGHRIWGRYGFRDSFNQSHDWYAKSYVGIDQGPIVCMIENHRSGLLWRLFMSVPEVQIGLRRLGFSSPALASDIA